MTPDERREYDRIWRKKRNDERKVNGRCIQCDRKVIDNKQLCIECRNKQKYERKKRSEFRKENNLCVKCGNSCVEGNYHCTRCFENNNKSYKKRKKINLEKGICLNCRNFCITDKDGIVLHKLCEICYLKGISISHFGNVSYWEKLKFLYENNPICPFTKKKLILGINTSLDHIVPKSRGGLNEISNLQWVYMSDNFDVNRMKGSMINEEFIDMVKIIFNYNFK